MEVLTVSTFPVEGQAPGTSRLRKETKTFMQAGYLENFIQSIFNAIEGGKAKTSVVGGDGRHYNAEAIQTIIKIAAANGVAKLIVGQQCLVGVARSMPTSAACDRVAEKFRINAYGTPTGWKYFGNLLDTGKVTLCREESAGTGSDHIREKDGLWAVLLWLNTLAVREPSVVALLEDHWKTLGRDYYSRHDFEGLEIECANRLVDTLRGNLSGLAGHNHAGLTVSSADEFAYHDPVDGSISKNRGIRVYFEGGARAVFRLSGTGTQGATPRVYLEQYVPHDGDHGMDPQRVLSQVWDAAYGLSGLESHLGRREPDVMT